MDNFKNINDNYGHAQGDRALRDTADILKNSVRHVDFLARYGGDEFVVIAASANDLEIVARIRQQFKSFNEEHHHPYSLEFSVGSDIYAPNDTRTAKELMGHIDSLMYQNKTERKERALYSRREAGQ